MNLILFGLLVFSLFFVVGKYFKNSEKWQYVDVIYYPLCALGVVLLFLYQNSDRQLLFLQEKMESEKLHVANIQKEKPLIIGYGMNFNADIYKSTLNLVSILKGGHECGSPPLNSPSCITAKKLSPLITKSINFVLNSDEPQIYHFCQSSIRLLDDIDKENIFLPTVLSSLRKHYIEGLQKNYNNIQSDSVLDYIGSFKEMMELEAENIFPLLANESISRKDFMSRYSSDIEYSLAIMRGYMTCFIAPPAYKNGKYMAWHEKNSHAEQQLYKTFGEIDQVFKKRNRPSNINMLILLGWPYVLVLALALKLGKGVAGLKINRTAKLGKSKTGHPNFNA